MKRHLLTAVFLLCMVSACEKQADIGAGSSTPVAFSVKETEKQAPAATRAGELTSSNLTSMGVFAYYTGQDNWNATTDIPNFMYNERVGRTNSTSPWTYEPVKYWPNTAGDKISYFAYAPHTNDVSGSYASTGATATGYPELYYEFASDASDQIDLLAAVALKDRTKSASSQAFAMKHVMTRVLVNVKCPDAIKVTRIDLIDLPANYGTLTWDNSGNPVWKDLGGSMSASYNTPTDVSADVTKQVAEFFLPPATPTAGSLDITFSLNGSTEYKNVDIPDSPAWTPGQAVAYTLNIEVGSEITLSVNTWNRAAVDASVGEEVPTTGYPFLMNGVVYESADKAYYVGTVGSTFPGGNGSGWYNWSEAVDICKKQYSSGPYLANGSYYTYEWRLPNIDELMNAVTLTDKNTGDYAAGGLGSTFWSTTPSGSDYRVSSSRGGGITTANPTSYSCRILCIRDMRKISNFPTVRYKDEYNTYYKDASTTYDVTSFQKGQYSGWIPYAAAETYCSNGRWGGYSDWRLPTRDEARNMMNLGKRVLLFSAAWSSTAAGTGQHYTINENGQDNPQDDNGDNGHTFCIRKY